MATPLSPHTHGQWALVTGGSSGIGKAHAAQLAARGFDVLLVGRNAERLGSTAAQLEADHGVRTETAQLDLSEPDSGFALLDQVGDRPVGAAVLVAGEGKPGQFVDTDLDGYLETVTVKTRTNTVIAHALARQMRDRGAGSLILVASSGGLQGVPDLSVNAAAEAYVIALAEALHHELRPHGVGVTALLPGPTRTPGLLAMVSEKDIPPGTITPEATARAGLRAADRNKRLAIPHVPSRIMLPLLPRGARIRLFGKVLGNLFARSTPAADPHAAR